MPRYVELFPRVLFRSRNPAPFRALVIGNHQARYMAPIFEIVLSNCSCDYLSCHQIETDAQRAAVETYLDESRESYQLILAQPLGPEWHALAKDALIARFGKDRTLFFLNLYFHGTYPDLTTLGDSTTRVTGPMGAMHSRIAVGAWMEGLKEDEIVRLFSPVTIERLAYPAFFEESIRELDQRESNCDTYFTETLINLIKSAYSFYLFNHPTPVLFVNYIAHMRDILNARGVAWNQIPLNAMLVSETLASHGAWPVYPELRELMAPHFPVSTTFILPDRGTGAEVIERETFVRRCIALYDSIGREKIGSLRQAQNAHTVVRQIL